MTFISYAQNHEDVMLWRALKHVQNGFYIDVGANHPADDSVTKALYDRGWSGINIEPLTEHIAQLRAERGRDINLQVALGAEEGEVELFSTAVRGLATASPAVAGRHQSAGLATSRCRVPLRRLDGVCAEYVKGEVHFLKIDVEGYERNVLEGMDFRRYRPWIVVVEATIPNSQEIDTNWEPILLEADYRYVYFDGLNRYYTACEHADLAASFAAPPNVFDDFISAERHRVLQCLEASIARAEQAETQLWQKDAQLRELEAQLREVESRAIDAEDRVHLLETQLDALYHSTSWRLTKPLRQLVTRLRQPPQPVPVSTGDAPRGATPADATAGEDKVGESVGESAAAPAHEAAGPLFPLLALGVHAERFTCKALPLQPLPPEALLLGAAECCGQLPQAPEFFFRVVGHVEGHFSLAIVNRALALALDSLTREQVVFLPYDAVPLANPTNLPAAQRARLAAMFERKIPASALARTVSIAHHYPLITDPEPAALRFVLFFWEETAVPAETVARIEAHFTAVLVATVFVKQALRNSGCSLPILVIPIGIDHLIDPALAPLGALQPVGGRPFRFLHVSSAFERKGVDVLLQAYFAEFTADDAVELLIKTFPNPHNRVHAQLAALRRGRSDAPSVLIDETALDDAAMLDLYRSAQALVLPARGEGFNLPAAEAMALGLPVIVTGFGGQLDFCTRRTALLTPFRFSRSRSHVKSSDACWVDPDIEALGDQMRILRREILAGDAALEQRRQAGREHVRQTYRWGNSAQAVLDATRWLAARAQQPQKGPRRLAVLSPWMTRCGIAEYCQNLLGTFSNAYALRVYCDGRTLPDAAQAVYQPAWELGNSASVCAVLDALLLELPEVLLVQHQPSLFSLTSEVCERLAMLHDHGCVVILELHSTLQLLHEYRESILTGSAVVALRRLDRVVVHKPEDYNNLLALGLVSNVCLLPHGVVQPLQNTRLAATREQWGIGETDLVLGCFGFVLPHKGIDTLVESILPLSEATQRRVHLLALNSTTDPLTEEILRQYQARAQALGIPGQITWITDYRPVDACIDLLGMADYIVFPYKQTRESASGAATIGLATLKPVLVSPLPIFSDLSDCSWRMAGEDVQAIVDAVCTLESDPEQSRRLLARQQEWLAERSWSRISAKFDALIQGLLIDRELAAVTSIVQAHGVVASPNGQAENAQLLVDISELYFRDAKTGIQRVVRSILSELIANPPKGFTIRPIYSTPEQAYRYTEKYTPGMSRNAGEAGEQPVKVREGDIFLGLDLSAHLFPRAEAELREFRLAGAKIYFVVYDIIPLRHPQFAVAALSDAFGTWMQALARQADCLLCISHAVVNEVRAWLSQHTDDSPLLKVRHFHLGADIENSAPSTGLPPDALSLIEKMRSAPAFLMVGTIEPRKGQVQTLAAFDELWRQGVAANLILIGKEGWLMADFSQTIRQHPELGQRLFWLEGVSDQFLEQIYAAGSCLIAASEAEGFGLPLIEAAQHQLPIIARDIPVFREIAGDHAYYFTGQQPEVLATTIRSWLTLHQAGLAPRSSTMPFLTWQESTRQMLDIILNE